MTETDDKPSLDPLSFDHAQFDEAMPTGVQCEFCGQAPQESYYGLNGRNICRGCLEQQKAAQKGSFFKALGLGTVAGLVGAGIYYGIRAVTGYDLALVTILVGIAVGIAVRAGAGGSQSKFYRVMAIGLTWVSMASTYVPEVAEGLMDEPGPAVTEAQDDGSEAADPDGVPPPTASTVASADDAPPSKVAAYVVAFVLSMFAPFLFLMEFEVIAFAIFAFGLWEAFRRSAPPPFEVGGPFQVSAPAVGPPPAAPAG